MRLFLKKSWRKWKSGLHKVNSGLAWLLMTLTYSLALMPVALVFKIFRKDLLDRSLAQERASYWLIKKEEEQSIKRVQRPY